MTIAEKLFVTSVKNGLVFLKQPALEHSVTSFWNTLSRITKAAGNEGDVFLRTEVAGNIPQLSFFQRFMETLRFAWNKWFGKFKEVAAKVKEAVLPKPGATATAEAAVDAAKTTGAIADAIPASTLPAKAVSEEATTNAVKTAGSITDTAPGTGTLPEPPASLSTALSDELAELAQVVKPGKYLANTTPLLDDFAKIQYQAGLNNGIIGDAWHAVSQSTHPDEALIQFLNRFKGHPLNYDNCRSLGLKPGTTVDDIVLPILEKHGLNQAHYGLNVTKFYKPATDELIGRYGENRIVSLAHYKKGSDQAINQGLRIGKADSDTLQMIHQIDETFEHSLPLAQGTTVYRGVKVKQNSEFARQLSTLKEGDVLTDHGFGSTTTESGIAKKFTNSAGYMLEINLPKGTKCLDIEQFTKVPQFKQQAGEIVDEAEILLARGSQFKVRSIAPTEGKPTQIVLDYMGHQPQPLQVIELSDPKAALDFALEKMYRFPDELPLQAPYFGKISQCIKEKRFDDVEKLIAISKDRAHYTKDVSYLHGLINPCSQGGWPNGSILHYFDQIGQPEKLIAELRELEQASGGSVKWVVQDCLAALKEMNIPLSETTLNALKTAQFLS